MENNFNKIISNKTDEDLIKIVTVDIEKYQTLAIESARKEIESETLIHFILKQLKKN